MSRHLSVTGVSLLSLLLAAGCGANTSRDHDKLICETLANVETRPTKPGHIPFSTALAIAQRAVRTRGYLTPRMTTDLRSVIKSSGALTPYQAFQADCQAVGVNGQLWQWPISY